MDRRLWAALAAVVLALSAGRRGRGQGWRARVARYADPTGRGSRHRDRRGLAGVDAGRRDGLAVQRVARLHPPGLCGRRPVDRDDGPREPAGLRALRGHDRHPVRWRGSRRGWAASASRASRGHARAPTSCSSSRRTSAFRRRRQLPRSRPLRPRRSPVSKDRHVTTIATATDPSGEPADRRRDHRGRRAAAGRGRHRR